MKPRALDLFCGAGGASMGLHRAGFDVTGVDIKPQRNYPFAFFQEDALEFNLEGYDFIWASPPCQSDALATLSWRVSGRRTYPDLILVTRRRLDGAGVPWAIENVPRSRVFRSYTLCGSHFGLRLIRHRSIEVSWAWLRLLPACSHPENPVVVAGHNTPTWSRKANGGKNHTLQERYDAMGIDWMNRDELSLAIPPAYSEFIGKQALSQLAERQLV